MTAVKFKNQTWVKLMGWEISTMEIRGFSSTPQPFQPDPDTPLLFTFQTGWSA